MIDTNELKQAAIQSVKAEIAAAMARRRKFDEGETADRALWSEIRAAALAGMDSVLQFDIDMVGSYFRQFPELASRPAPHGPIGAGIRTVILELVFEQMSVDIQALHASQFAKYGSGSIEVWSAAAIRVVRNHGDPVSKSMRDNVAAVDDHASIEILDAARETLDYVATRIEAHAAYQRHAERGNYETLARRLREAIEFIEIEIEIDLEAERHRTPGNAPSPAPRS